MSGKLVLVVGGCRSGKSSFARVYAEAVGGEKIYLATAPVLDDEMAERVARHREERRDGGWETVEEPLDPAGAIGRLDPAASVLVDCLTLWLGNLLHAAETSGTPLPDESFAARRATALADAARGRSGLTVLVANEVGLGIVPDNPLARRFRDLAGRINQTLAARADEVHFLACGISIRLK